MRLFFNPKDLTGPSFHFIYDLNKGFQNYEELDKDEIIKQLPENGVFVDIGANIGLFSLYVSRKLPKVQVFSFEPNSKVRHCLEQTKKYNQLENLTIFSHAIGKKKSTGKLFKSIHNDGGHSLNPDYEQIDGDEFENVTIRPLSRELFSTHKKINVIKIDVEGAEQAVLEGAIDIIKKDRPMLLIEIFNQDLLNKEGVYQILAEHFFDQVTIRSAKTTQKYKLSQVYELAQSNLKAGTQYNNYIFEFI